MTPRGRLTITGLMAVTAAAGLTLVAARWVSRYDVDWAVVFLPMGIALQLATWGLVRSRRTRRRFWAGFLIVGGIAMGSLVAAGLCVDSPYYNARVAGIDAIEGSLFRMLPIPRPSIFTAVRAIAAFIDQGGLGVLGGGAAVLIGRVVRPRPSRRGRASG